MLGGWEHSLGGTDTVEVSLTLSPRLKTNSSAHQDLVPPPVRCSPDLGLTHADQLLASLRPAQRWPQQSASRSTITLHPHAGPLLQETVLLEGWRPVPRGLCRPAWNRSQDMLRKAKHMTDSLWLLLASDDPSNTKCSLHMKLGSP